MLLLLHGSRKNFLTILKSKSMYRAADRKAALTFYIAVVPKQRFKK